MLADTKKCQIILLTGYLGAGKTTFLTNILKNTAKLKFAVIQNEFADEMGIEAPLITDSTGEIFDKFYELPNGCICCSAKGQLIVAIEYFLKSARDLDFILVEANGLSDPSQLIQQLWVDDGLELPIKLHSVVSIVASHRIDQLKDNEIFQRQLIFSDLILLNFSSAVVEKEKRKEIEETVVKFNSSCKFAWTDYSEIEVEKIVKLDHLQPDFDLAPMQGHDLGHFSTLFYKTRKLFSRQLWEGKLGHLLWESDFKLLRVKGLLQIKDEPFAFSLQGVNDIYELTETKLLQQDIVESKILFIGQSIVKESIIEIIEKD